MIPLCSALLGGMGLKKTGLGLLLHTPVCRLCSETQEGPLSEENDPCALQLLADEPQGDNQSQHKAINVDVPGPDD